MSDPPILERIAALFAERGAQEYHGEAVTQLEHALQAAASAEADALPYPAIVAALLHDVGHLLHSSGENIAEQGIDDRHEMLGVRFLSAAFGPAVTEPIRLHVAAKRYLVAVQPDYLKQLSAASVRSLELQGGPMTPAEVHAFESHPEFAIAVKIRHYDDRAKVVGLMTPALTHFRKHLEACVIRE